MTTLTFNAPVAGRTPVRTGGPVRAVGEPSPPSTESLVDVTAGLGGPPGGGPGGDVLPDAKEPARRGLGMTNLISFILEPRFRVTFLNKGSS